MRNKRFKVEFLVDATISDVTTPQEEEKFLSGIFREHLERATAGYRDDEEDEDGDGDDEKTLLITSVSEVEIEDLGRVRSKEEITEWLLNNPGYSTSRTADGRNVRFGPFGSSESFESTDLVGAVSKYLDKLEGKLPEVTQSESLTVQNSNRKGQKWSKKKKKFRLGK